ncbi:iron-sulfur cluster assembly scaffold protein [Sphingomonas sp.]|uniref:iron-sulfur cluster assembly scaffold protein n=1 Tax=Sphingomonas sp. TaxID=28214 RepID=UPI0025D1E898|nr:iron-sulfur cluster assembly scaffold protein [Sphingomonas sp.]
MSAPLYTRDILRLASAIPFLVRFEEVDGVERRSPTCGSRVRAAVELDAAGRVASLSQAVEACAFGQASASLMGAHAIGKDAGEARIAVWGVQAWLGGDDTAVTAWPGLAALEPARSRMGRHGAILLPFHALLAAIEAAA